MAAINGAVLKIDDIEKQFCKLYGYISGNMIQYNEI